MQTMHAAPEDVCSLKQTWHAPCYDPSPGDLWGWVVINGLFDIKDEGVCAHSHLS